MTATPFVDVRDGRDDHGGGRDGAGRDLCRPISTAPTSTSRSHQHTPDDPDAAPLGAAVTEHNGIAYVAFPIFRLYHAMGQPLYKYIVRGLHRPAACPSRRSTTDSAVVGPRQPHPSGRERPPRPASPLRRAAGARQARPARRRHDPRHGDDRGHPGPRPGDRERPACRVADARLRRLDAARKLHGAMMPMAGRGDPAKPAHPRGDRLRGNRDMSPRFRVRSLALRRPGAYDGPRQERGTMAAGAQSR